MALHSAACKAAPTGSEDPSAEPGKCRLERLEAGVAPTLQLMGIVRGSAGVNMVLLFRLVFSAVWPPHPHQVGGFKASPLAAHGFLTALDIGKVSTFRA